MTLFRSLSIAACLTSIAVFLPANADAQDANPTSDTFKLDAITCWDLGTMETEDEAAYTLLMLYGYHSGAINKTEHSAAGIQAALGAVGTVCEENPEMTALEALAKAMKK